MKCVLSILVFGSLLFGTNASAEVRALRVKTFGVIWDCTLKPARPTTAIVNRTARLIAEGSAADGPLLQVTVYLPDSAETLHGCVSPDRVRPETAREYFEWLRSTKVAAPTYERSDVAPDATNVEELSTAAPAI